MSTLETEKYEPSRLIKGLQAFVAVSSLTFLSFAGVIFGSIVWGFYFSAAPAQNWNGCAAPHSEAERQEWSASAKATGETLCEPGLLEQE
ncbi:MAG: hypothetical protein AAGB19_23430 [Cyanobacteria bacterium P01_F01_bin.3]